MIRFDIDLQDYQFILQEVLDVQNQDISRYGELEADFTSTLIEEAAKFAREVLEPLNSVGDSEGCRLENGVIRTPKGFKEAFDLLRDAGWTGVDCAEEYGGQGAPYLLGTAVGEIHVAANMALNMYQGLTHGVYSTILAHGSPEQKTLYLPRLVSCEWTGTMNLTEAQAGTDLGLIRTKATPNTDGSYALNGEKIFISAGDHDLSRNVIHLVLARLPDVPAGVKGISLFIVPKILVDAEGNLGAPNRLSVGKLEEKMGIHGNATCVMNYDGATAYLVGEPHKGLRYMFTMMNEARLGVGLQGLAQAEGAYMMARNYALERQQGRAIGKIQYPDLPADPLIVHPDIRRMLLVQRTFIEAGRTLLFFGAMLIDRAHKNKDEKADNMASLLIPVIKAYLTDKGFESAVLAQQIFGGHGYIEETGVSQYVRDARIAMIYEGANGIQAIDLVARKLSLDGGGTIMEFFELVKQEIAEAKEIESLSEIRDALKESSKALQAAVMLFVGHAQNPNFPLSGANSFLHLFGVTLLGFMWLKRAKAAHKALEAGKDDKSFYETKLVLANFYARHIMPEALALYKRIEAGDLGVMVLPDEAF